MSSRFVLHPEALQDIDDIWEDRKSTRLNSSHGYSSYAVFGLKKKKKDATVAPRTEMASAVTVRCFPQSPPTHTSPGLAASGRCPVSCPGLSADMARRSSQSMP